MAPGVRLFESLDDHVARTKAGDIPIEWAVKKDIPAEGLTTFRPDVDDQGAIELILREDVYQALRRDEPRARFTMTHELAHVMLHAEDLVHHGGLPHFGASFRRAGRAPHPQYLDTEWQANAWAAAFLMPAKELREFEVSQVLTLMRVQRKFGVSSEAAELRLKVYQARRDELIG